jgi:hypothetical protein
MPVKAIRNRGFVWQRVYIGAAFADLDPLVLTTHTASCCIGKAFSRVYN